MKVLIRQVMSLTLCLPIEASTKLPELVTLRGNHNKADGIDSSTFEVRAGVTSDGKFWLNSVIDL